MEAVLKIFVISFLSFYVVSLPVDVDNPSNIEVGTLGINDTLMTSLHCDIEPNPEVNLTAIMLALNTHHGIFTYVTAIEYGDYPEARAEIVAGGPGHQYVVFDLIPGPPQGLNYTLEAYGQLDEALEIDVQVRKYYVTEVV